MVLTPEFAQSLTDADRRHPGEEPYCHRRASFSYMPSSVAVDEEYLGYRTTTGAEVVKKRCERLSFPEREVGGDVGRLPETNDA